MTSCQIRNYRPQRYSEVSGAEYIVKKDFITKTKFQNYGLPSGVYGFITNEDQKISEDETKRIGREQVAIHELKNAFLLDDKETNIDNDDSGNKYNRGELFSKLSHGMIYQAQVELGKKDEFDIRKETSEYHISNLEKYKQELGIDSGDVTVKDAINEFLEKYKSASNNNLLLSPIRYLLKKYDGICNYASNKASGGSVLFIDPNPRAGTMGEYGNLYTFKSKKAKSPKKKSKKSKTKKSKSKKSPKKRKSVRKSKNPKKSLKKRTKLYKIV